MKNFLFVFVFAFMIFGLSNAVMAQTILEGGGSLKECGNCEAGKVPNSAVCKKFCGTYELNDFMRIAIKVSDIILGLAGALAFAAFVIGGFLMLISRGNKTLLDKGTATLKNAVIGLIIVLTAFVVIKFTFQIFNITWTGQQEFPQAPAAK